MIIMLWAATTENYARYAVSFPLRLAWLLYLSTRGRGSIEDTELVTLSTVQFYGFTEH